MKRALFAAVLALFIVGCTDWERTTFQTLAATQATLNQAQIDYETGIAIPHSQIAYTVITKAKATDTLAVNAMVTYEQLKANKAAPSVQAQAQADVSTAIAQLPTLITDVKALYLKGGK